MRIAIVNQAIDRVFPPFQNSVGACSYGLGEALTESADVTIFGRRDAHVGVGETEEHAGIHFRFSNAPRADRTLFRFYDRFAPWLRPLNGGMVEPVSSSWALFPFYTRAAARAVGKGAYDVVHVQHSTQFVHPLKARNPRAAVVVELHAELYPQNNLRTIERRLAAADLIVTPSDYVTDRTRGQLPTLAARCHTLSNGIDPNEFPVAKDHRESPGPLTIMYAGSVSPNKGVHVLIEAFAQLAATHPDTRLEIVGPLHTVPYGETFPADDPATARDAAYLYEGDYVERLKASVPNALPDRVNFTGGIPREELVARYAEADVFAFPSIWDEGFGLPPVEAMAAGVPVVASRSGAVSETVIDGQTGILVEKSDATALAAGMVRLLDDRQLRASMGEQGRRRALGHYTWSEAATQALDLYELARRTG